jgi:Uma2 family endonuclease
MKAVMTEVPPALLEERRRLGLDLFDEMWEGVLHMNPPPLGDHQRLGTELVAVLTPIAKSLGFVPFYEVGFYAAPDDYRAPDHAYARPEQLSREGISGAELVIEFRSPGDETYEKLDWYATRGVPEIVVIHPSTRVIEMFRTVAGQLRVVDPNPDGSVGLVTLGGTRLATVDTDDGPRLRVTAPDGTITDC